MKIVSDHVYALCCAFLIATFVALIIALGSVSALKLAACGTFLAAVSQFLLQGNPPAHLQRTTLFAQLAALLLFLLSLIVSLA